MAVVLLVVEREVLDGGRHALGLHAVDVADGDARGEPGIFSHVFEVAAAHRCACDVDARTEQHVHAAGPGVVAKRDAHLFREGGIPRCGKCDRRWIRDGGDAGTQAGGTVREANRLDADGRLGMRVPRADAAHQFDLLLEGQCGYHLVDAVFHGGIGGLLRGESCGKWKQDSGETAK
jgi:hypothetical protein